MLRFTLTLFVAEMQVSREHPYRVPKALTGSYLRVGTLATHIGSTCGIPAFCPLPRQGFFRSEPWPAQCFQIDFQEAGDFPVTPHGHRLPFDNPHFFVSIFGLSHSSRTAFSKRHHFPSRIAWIETRSEPSMAVFSSLIFRNRAASVESRRCSKVLLRAIISAPFEAFSSRKCNCITDSG